ncbi:hypothetical protein A3A01_00335 [Candidatus Nomurabacteria bacterium RIFCSPLOWO2_01_FULL_39_17]|uniref:Uncharacterized protein n=1 Tax=Candidatus Nomurabacteria bacterium RIFCSPLOWO2_01_FULL_39_17 TaxID=1801770 RepID=A0A1F6WWX3_9BACT|nr:MAG: hypothetical protein A3A01_00335 [Candidatus Nomurabacteria bacterium RIFCSPLOWO2_01_FULL_39_17]
MVPKKETCLAEEKNAERKNTVTKPAPESNSQDLGRVILPSENRDMVQKIIETTKPTTSSRPLDVSTEILVKGKKKIGNNTITKNNDTKDSLSKRFDNIFLFFKIFIIYNKSEIHLHLYCTQ